MEQSNPEVSVVVSHHLDELRRYLHATLWALRQSVGVRFETIVISDAETPLDAIPEGVDSFVYDKSFNSHSKKMEHGARIAKGEYVCFLSDDVMFAKDTLLKLYQAAKMTGGIVSPFGQAEAFSGRFIVPKSHVFLSRPGQITDFGLHDTENLALSPDMSLTEVDGWWEQISNRRVETDVIAIQPWVPFYAPMMPKSVLERVGDFDPRLDSRHNDQLFCYQAGRMGIPSFFHLGAPVVHFGSKTLDKVYTKADMDAASEAMAKIMSEWNQTPKEG